MSATKPPELVEPDPRWQLIVGNRADLSRVAAGWHVSNAVRREVAQMLHVARELFVHSYFVYEFGVVAVTWSLIAIEAALRDCLDSPDEREGLAKLVGRAQGMGWLTED